MEQANKLQINRLLAYINVVETLNGALQFKSSCIFIDVSIRNNTVIYDLYS